MRNHWQNCITHFDNDVTKFATDYFSDQRRKCLLVAAAGFDPRSQTIAKLLSRTLSDRLSALFIREERTNPDRDLVVRANENEENLRGIVPASKVISIDIFGDDGAAIAGARIVAGLSENRIPADVTDVVLDLSALSIGIGFPAASLLLTECESRTDLTFHIMIASNPELDDCIVGAPADRAIPVKGFSGSGSGYNEHEIATIWVPQLAKGRTHALTEIGLSIGASYKVCPVVPFPARNPRRADDLLTEYQNELVNEWEVDPRDIVYASERNPLDSYRTLSTLKERFDQTVDGIYEPNLVLSPMGSKVMAAGALMAAIEHNLKVQYVETEQYLFDENSVAGAQEPDMIVHILLSGPAYKNYGASKENENSDKG
ncbi:hypothetical protein [uncultured Tateyamaria sp.]|uniref:hypothetical protein n=1 Tax=uncultured Tateyamaria sp. TaxID=455651 RepID=UPI00262BEE18|nr:hypothetical protein [uncultured Tateyamaria sp.]